MMRRERFMFEQIESLVWMHDNPPRNPNHFRYNLALLREYREHMMEWAYLRGKDEVVTA